MFTFIEKQLSDIFGLYAGSPKQEPQLELNLDVNNETKLNLAGNSFQDDGNNETIAVLLVLCGASVGDVSEIYHIPYQHLRYLAVKMARKNNHDFYEKIAIDRCHEERGVMPWISDLQEHEEAFCDVLKVIKKVIPADRRVKIRDQLHRKQRELTSSLRVVKTEMAIAEKLVG